VEFWILSFIRNRIYNVLLLLLREKREKECIVYLQEFVVTQWTLHIQCVESPQWGISLTRLCLYDCLCKSNNKWSRLSDFLFFIYWCVASETRLSYCREREEKRSNRVRHNNAHSFHIKVEHRGNQTVQGDETTHCSLVYKLESIQYYV